MPPPSSGGVLLLQMLNVLEGYKLRANDPASLHLMIETMKHAYADRAQLSRRSRLDQGAGRPG